VAATTPGFVALRLKRDNGLDRGDTQVASRSTGAFSQIRLPMVREVPAAAAPSRSRYRRRVKETPWFGHIVGVTQITAATIGATASASEDASAVRQSLTDPSAFAGIFDRHFVVVHRYLHRRAGRDIADELAGETFRIAFEARARWSRATPDARPWLLGIATNLLRRRHRTEERRLRALARTGVDEWATLDETALVERADARQARAALAAGLAALAPDDRDVVLLVALADLSYDEVARALDIPPGTVASRLNRARRVLATTLARSEDALHG
jgi:RNA polymerase sigma factor (sigma-70 family)